MDSSQIGKRAWSYAGVLQDAGLSCFEYVEQLTLLLFLKMADQLTESPYSREPIVPPELGWKALLPLDGAALEDQYRTSLEKLGVKPGMLGVIFKGARCEIHNPALLKQLIVNLLDKVDWMSLPVDVKGTIYEELLTASGDRPDVLVALSGDLGSCGHVDQIIELVAPRYDAERHGPATGLNLLQAY
ncbi:MAG: SAM-dependent DNA methyltransferase, partial [Oscillochloris sp.]|nr:SAM-dependent DNA methyltransferase [Oscillochloris sp.]